MSKIKRISMPPEYVDHVLKVIAPVRKELADKLGMTAMGIQMWRKRGVPGTGATVLAYLVRRVVPHPKFAKSPEEAMAPRLDAIRAKAAEAGYDEDRIQEVMAEVAEMIRSGTELPVSMGAPPISGQALRKALEDRGLTMQAFSDEIGAAIRTVQYWVAGENSVEGPVSFYVRARLAEDMIEGLDGVDPLTRAVADLAQDAMTYGWDADQVVEVLEAEPAPGLKV